MANREPVQCVEIDIDHCTLEYGSAPCTAVLGTTGIRKCFKTFQTCQAKLAFVKGTKTLRFINNRSNLPKTSLFYPVLEEKGVSEFTSTVNIAGSDPKMSAFGRRATVSVSLRDFVDDDIGLDDYALQRVSGAAQASGIGYNPAEFGTFFTRLKARWPFYSGKPLRVIDGHVDNGVFTPVSTRHFVITEMKGPDDKGRVVFEAKDILSLADDKKALVPKPSRGKLSVDIDETLPATFDLTPAGIGSEYAESGFATIGSEIVSFTRVGDTITLTGRGLKRTVIGPKSQGDSFQQAYNVERRRVDDVLYDLLANYANIPTSFLPLTTKWRPEITTWMSSVLLDTIITRPMGVAQAVGELSDLGLSIWWDEVSQSVELLANHPIENELIYPISDRNNIKAISQEDRDEDRITQVHFYTKQTDPTKSATDKNNYDQLNVIIDPIVEGVNAHNEAKVREVFCRWLNNGADAVVRILSIRLLNRFNTSPKIYTITLDSQDESIKLADVLNVESRLITDEAGLPVQELLQVFRKESSRAGGDFKVSAQAFNYKGKYGKIMDNSAPNYSLATEEQKRTGLWFVDGSTLTFPDGARPYSFI